MSNFQKIFDKTVVCLASKEKQAIAESQKTLQEKGIIDMFELLVFKLNKEEGVQKLEESERLFIKKITNLFIQEKNTALRYVELITSEESIAIKLSFYNRSPLTTYLISAFACDDKIIFTFNDQEFCIDSMCPKEIIFEKILEIIFRGETNLQDIF